MLEKYEEKIIDFVFKVGPKILLAIIIAVAGIIAIKIICKISAKAMTKANTDFSLKNFIIRTIKIIGYIIIIISVLSTLGISTTGLIAGFSAAAAAVALALKDSLSNIAGGIILLFSKPFETGDYIEYGKDGGFVKQIDILHTIILTRDNRRIIIPNSILSQSEVTNYSKESIRRVDLNFSISYENDAELAKKTVLEVVGNHKLVINSPETPFARVGEYADSAVNITMRAWCNAEDYWTVYYDLIEQIREAFDKNGIVIPYNQLDVHICNHDC